MNHMQIQLLATVAVYVGAHFSKIDFFFWAALGCSAYDVFVLAAR